MNFPRRYAQIAFHLIAGLMLLSVLLSLVAAVIAAEMPRSALTYQRELTREARFVWGMDAPVAAFAAQIHQESHWNNQAKSAFAGGLAQFTPDTAAWISGAYPKDLGSNQPYNPSWALRALVTYDQLLYRHTKADTSCDKMWKALWAYNGGDGWVQRDEKKAAAHGANPRSALAVEPFNAGRAPAMFAENRSYSRVILFQWQPIYISWGGSISCS